MINKTASRVKESNKQQQRELCGENNGRRGAIQTSS
jgi:hypothetical protein